MPDAYSAEQAAAEDAGVRGVPCPGSDFNRLVAAGDRLIFVVTVDRQLIVASQVLRGFEVRHSVLAKGQPVLTAGEIEIVAADTFKCVVEITNKSGHYRPDAASLEVAIDLLKDLGFEVPADVVQPYPGE